MTQDYDMAYATAVEREKLTKLRDEFAGLAMQALIASAPDNIDRLDKIVGFKKISEAAYAAADAMLKAREQ